MRVYSSLHTLTLVATTIGLGCTAPEPARDADTARTASTVDPETWYRRVRTLDLTGDGDADSVSLEAVGTRPDSLRVRLSVIVDGEEKHREEWGSSYELALAGSAVERSPRADTFLRGQLDSVLSSVVVQQLETPAVRLMAEDSAILAGLEPRPKHRISYSYGYESTVRLVWDEARARFVRLWSCC